jgi:hypothetical protein
VARHGDTSARKDFYRGRRRPGKRKKTHENKVDYSMGQGYHPGLCGSSAAAGLLLSLDMFEASPLQEIATQRPHVPLSLWQRQLLFLRQYWWRTEPLSLWERLMAITRGLFLMAVACIGAIVAFTSILNSSGKGMDALGKLVAEFMLPPIALLALIMILFGGSLIVRAMVSPWPDPNATPTQWDQDRKADLDADVS